MRQVHWAELPPKLQGPLDQFRMRHEEAIDSVYLVKRAVTRTCTRANCGWVRWWEGNDILS